MPDIQPCKYLPGKTSIARGNTRGYDAKSSIKIVRGEGPYLWDELGNQYLDLVCGYSITNFGHSFAPAIDAACTQLHQLVHVTGQTHALQIDLSARLCKLFNPRLASADSTKIAFASSGARAVETAVRCAQLSRPGRVLALQEAFHGRTLALGTHPQGILETPERAYFPKCDSCSLGLNYPSCQVACGQPLFDFIQSNSDEISAILIEPILGVAGWVVPPNEFLIRLRQLTHQSGIVLIADEVQTAFGRCGAWTRLEQIDVQPDLFVIGKSLAAGVSGIAAVVGPAEILDKPPEGSLTESFAANPVACAAALATLEHLDSGQVFLQSDWLGKQVRAICKDSCQAIGLPIVIGGIGACCTLQLPSAERSMGQTGSAARQQSPAAEFAQACLESGMFVHLAGRQRDRVVLLPPLNLKEPDLVQLELFMKRAIERFRARPLSSS